MSPPPSGSGGEPLAPDVARIRVVKSATAFRTISEVADDLNIPQHVLRFWETKFTQVKPLKRGGGRRYYRPEDITLLRRIADLLYVQGFTIKGVQRLLREGGGRLADDIPPPAGDERQTAAEGPDTPELPGLDVAGNEEAARLRAILREVLAELKAMRALLPP